MAKVILAAEDGDFMQLFELLKEGTDANFQDWSGRTPLHTAADADGRTEDHEAIVDVLLSGDALPDIRDSDQQTPLHLAAKRGFLEAMVSLLEAGADVGAIDREGNTPLHLAAVRGQLGACRLLLGEMADPNALNKRGQAPLDMARGNEVKQILAEAVQLVENAPEVLPANGEDDEEEEEDEYEYESDNEEMSM